MPNYLDNLFFDNLKLKLGPEFKLQYSEIVEAYLETVFDLSINGGVGKDLNARGLIDLKKVELIYIQHRLNLIKIRKTILHLHQEVVSILILFFL